MTIDQCKIYIKSIVKRQIKDDIGRMGLTRAAYHADEQSYTDIIRDMENY